MSNQRQVTIDSAQQYLEAVSAAEKTGDEDYFFWFTASTDINDYFSSGIKTLEDEILTPTVLRTLGSINSASALEIGHGGGRILIAACSKFKHVTGVDVHRSNDPVKRKLASTGINNLIQVKNSINNKI